ncbi:MAG: hypothetical protein EXR77_09655 [Myxococcales bacterium]|nr:hypothetical protein [Myxococcales bacterium]
MVTTSSAHSPTPRPPRPAVTAPKRKRTALWTITVLLLVVVGGITGSTFIMAGLIRSKLEAIATDAGLSLAVESLSVSPFGRINVTNLALKRKDGTAVASVQQASAELSVWKALMGRRRPQRAEVNVFVVDLLLQDGKPKELLELYKAARKHFPPRQKIEDSEDKATKGSTALFLEQGSVGIRVAGKGSQYLPQGLRVRDIAMHVDLTHGIGDLTAVVDGTVASRLAANLETQADGPPRLNARFQPEFRVKMPASAPLPLGVDSVAIAGLRFDAVAGGSLEDLILRKGNQVVLSVKHIRPQAARLGASAEHIAFAVAQAAKPKEANTDEAVKDKSKKSKDKLAVDAEKEPAREPDKEPSPVPTKASNGAPQAPAGTAQATGDKMWNGTAERLSIGLEGAEGAEIGLLARLEGLKVTVPGNAAVATVDSVQLRTAGMPGENALDSLTEVIIDHPAVDLPWRQDALGHFPGGSQLWKAVNAAEIAKLKKEIEDEAEEELAESDLRPDQKADIVAKKVDEKLKAAGKAGAAINGDGGKAGLKVAGKPGSGATDPEGRKAVAPARKSWTSKQIAPLRELYGQLLSSGDFADGLVEKLAKAPRCKVELKAGRLGLVKEGAGKPFGGIQEFEVTATALQGDGSRGIAASLRPFDDERVWGEAKLDLLAGPGPRMSRAKIQIKGGHFAQALRIVSAAVAVAPDADIVASIELKRPTETPQVMQATGEVAVKKVGFDWWRLAPKTIDVASMNAKFVATVSAAAKSLKFEFTDLQIGDAHLHVLAEATEIDSKPAVHVVAEMAKQDCGAALRAIPAGMLTSVGAVEATGEMAFSVDIKVPLHDPYGSKLEVTLDDAACELKSLANIDLQQIAGEFSWPVNENGVRLDDVQVGPKSGSWVPLAEIPKWTWWAMIATEDGNFYKHRGIAVGLVLRAIKLDLDYGRFVYGGSSITQQLVKNVYLTRDKTLSRKFEELLIVWHLERNLAAVLPPVEGKEPPNKRAKDKLLELYINMIEFGGDGKETKVYGIARAAKSYFDLDARALGPTESAFLAAIKPFPKYGWRIFMRKYWEKPGGHEPLAARVPAVVEKMRKEGYITEEQYISARPFVPRFMGWEAIAKPASEVPTGGTEE